MLELRVRTLAPVVDLFLVVTCSLTHQGEPCNITLPSLPVDNVMHYEVTATGVHPEGYTLGGNERGGCNSELFMYVEHQHRSGIRDAVRCAHITDPNALILVSDVDELPAVDAISDQDALRERLGDDWLVLEMRNHSTALDLLHPKQPELTTTISRLANLHPQAMRDLRGPLRAAGRYIPDAGIHCSWFGTDEVRQRKLDSFSHAEHRHWSPVEGRRTRMHINGEHLRKLSADEMQALTWPAPLTDPDSGFVIPECWWDGDPTPLTDDRAHESAA